MTKSKTKTMLICYFDVTGTIHFESVPVGTNVKQTICVEVLKRLVDAVKPSAESSGEIARRFFDSSVTVCSREKHLCHGSCAVLS
jgi:hypothetical protein